MTGPVSTGAIPQQAATMVAVVQAEFGLEVLMLRRPPGGMFGGAWVFPGGLVDPVDREGASDLPVILRRTALREFEEEVGLKVDPEAPRFLSRWITPSQFPRRYDTWFFVCPLEARGKLRISATEVVEAAFVAPRVVLAAHQAQQWHLVLPTLAHIRWLTRFTTVEQALVAAGAARPEPLEPQLAADGSVISIDLPL